MGKVCKNWTMVLFHFPHFWIPNCVVILHFTELLCAASYYLFIFNGQMPDGSIEGVIKKQAGMYLDKQITVRH